MTAAALVGCAGSDDQAGAPGTPAPATATGGAATTSAPASPTGAPPASVPETLRFTARTVDGQTFEGASLAGKPAALWFWAAWCTRCRAAADDVAAIQRDTAAEANLVGVAGLGSGEGAMKRFIADTGIGGFPNLADDKGEVWRKFDVTTQEYWVLLDSTGKVVHSGPLSTTEARQRINGLS
ncbi:redoxin domain-containing protein [Micromonospora sp. WMMD558]|uniref:redoxin domain-containing protein n=1 Tax=unclassified Micromonospora TaxID=2617518 RepID=UPI0012B4A6F7|nr:redoxin domain-containing protein [Micromonospora sp. WMMC415]QGN50990.1 redoxin domain-containing protein [Micromonospora sp. WMMC415]